MGNRRTADAWPPAITEQGGAASGRGRTAAQNRWFNAVSASTSIQSISSLNLGPKSNQCSHAALDRATVAHPVRSVIVCHAGWGRRLRCELERERELAKRVYSPPPF